MSDTRDALRELAQRTIEQMERIAYLDGVPEMELSLKPAHVVNLARAVLAALDTPKCVVNAYTSLEQRVLSDFHNDGIDAVLDRMAAALQGAQT